MGHCQLCAGAQEQVCPCSGTVNGGIVRRSHTSPGQLPVCEAFQLLVLPLPGDGPSPCFNVIEEVNMKLGLQLTSLGAATGHINEASSVFVVGHVSLDTSCAPLQALSWE